MVGSKDPFGIAGGKTAKVALLRPNDSFGSVGMENPVPIFLAPRKSFVVRHDISICAGVKTGHRSQEHHLQPLHQVETEGSTNFCLGA